MRRVLNVGTALFLATTVLAGTQAGAQLADKKALTRAAAKKMAAAAEAEATKNSWRVVIAIVDDGGHLLYLQRTDETQIGSIDIAIGKATTSVALKRPSKAVEDIIAGGRNAFLGVKASRRCRAASPSWSTTSWSARSVSAV